MTDREQLSRAHYECLDSGDYERLESILTATFVHERPDMTLSGREEFVTFMREQRPRTDTTHRIETVYLSDDGTAVEGRLVADSETLTGFVDLFEFDDGRIDRIDTYVD